MLPLVDPSWFLSGSSDGAGFEFGDALIPIVWRIPMTQVLGSQRYWWQKLPATGLRPSVCWPFGGISQRPACGGEYEMTFPIWFLWILLGLNAGGMVITQPPPPCDPTQQGCVVERHATPDKGAYGG